MKFFAVMLMAILCAAAPAAAADIVGRASVFDGDTLEIRGNRIRLFGIDAPESNQTCQPADGRAIAAARPLRMRWTQ